MGLSVARPRAARAHHRRVCDPTIIEDECPGDAVCAADKPGGTALVPPFDRLSRMIC